MFLGLGISCSVASMNAARPGSSFSTSVRVVSLWVFWCCLVGVGKISWLGSSFFVFFRMLVWLTSQGYPSGVEEV